MTRDEILKAVASKKTYVTLTPFVNDTDINLFSTVEFTEEELTKKVDNKKAIEFFDLLVDEKRKEDTDIGLNLNIGFLVDSRVRKDKCRGVENLEEKDFLKNIFAITIDSNCFSSPKNKDGIYRSKTFLVDLNAFISELQKRGWLTNFSNRNGRYLYSQNEMLIPHRLFMTPTLRVYNTVKNYFKIEAMDKFLKLFFPNTPLSIDIFREDTQVSFAKIQGLVTTSIEEETEIYRNSSISKVLSALKVLSIPMDALTIDNINSAIAQLNEKRTEFAKRNLETRLRKYIEAFHEEDPVEPGLYSLARLFYTLTSDIGEYISKGIAPINFQENFKSFQSELNRQIIENPNRYQVRIADSFGIQFLNPYLDFLTSLTEIEETLTDFDASDIEELITKLSNWLSSVLEGLNETDWNANVDDFYCLVSHAVFCINKKLQKPCKSINLQPVPNNLT